MNEKAQSIVKNLGYTISANVLVLIISIVLNLVVPKFLGVHEYSYWQLYVFYSSYVGFFHFGWLDGIYLRIGGEEYEDLDKKNLGSQFWLLAIMEVFISIIFSLYVVLFMDSTYKSDILLMTTIVLIIMNCKTFILYILQSTNRIKEYAQLSKNDRYIYVVLLMVYLLSGGRNFMVLISLDIFSKLLITIWGFTRINDMLLIKPSLNKVVLIEILHNIKIGSNLMISNIANMLILGVSRFFVEQKWSIETFGKLSFTLSISNMFMVFINAVGIVMFPMLRRTNDEHLPKLYLNLRNVFVPFTFILLLFFNPIRILLELWLPSYKESLYFMGILFPMIVYEGRMSLLINTYLKTLRKEKTILFVNIVTLTITFIGTWYSVFVVSNINFTVMIIMFCLLFRCVFAELMLARDLKLSLVINNVLEAILTAIFVSGNLLLSNGQSFTIYLLSIIVFVFIKRKTIKNSIFELVYLMKN